uniref:BC002195 protein n=1 Tax=Mus musculus TaxID=10090 RepID=Q99LW3_MOUSE|nr:BC002195 protein [Mus musculus]
MRPNEPCKQMFVTTLRWRAQNYEQPFCQ